MIENTRGSTNADPEAGPSTSSRSTEKVPLITRHSFFDRLNTMLGLGSTSTERSSTSQGYVEFGAMNSEPARQLSTFAGVFAPVVLSMFSAMLFLRLGYLVGNAGLLVTLLQFLIAYSIQIFTVASVCAVATNGAVEGGGAYFMISRVLGPEFGGSIGTLFFFANVVSSGLCIVGCTESVMQYFGDSGYIIEHGLPDSPWWRFLYCSVINSLNLIICLIGAGMFAKTTTIIFVIVTVCIISTIISFATTGAMSVPIPSDNTIVQNATFPVNGSYTGLNLDTFMSNLYSHYGKDYTNKGQVPNFSIMFGVLFSGVTGIMAGTSMSGELKEPSRNITRGTWLAMLFTFCVYVILTVLTAATCSTFLLQNDYLYLMPINVWSPFIVIGTITATASASLSNLIGGSRVLEALAKDNIYGRLMGWIVQGTWRNNPLAAVLASWFLVEIILLVGSLNVIAQINSVLFLLTYLVTNMACLGLELASAPNFRPTFTWFSWHTALLGLVSTLIMMFVVDPIYATSSIIFCVLLVVVLHLFSPSRHAQWGSISQALIFHQVRKYLLLLDPRKDHVKFWRPQMLLMVSNPRSSCPLIHIINDMKKGGLYVLGHVKVGNFSSMDADPAQEETLLWLTIVDRLKVKAFVELTVASTVREGLQHLIRLSGMGGMKPNTIVLGFYDDQTPVDFFDRYESKYKISDEELMNVAIANSGKVFELRSLERTERTMDPLQYVGMVEDVLKLRKNLCLCRHFHRLDKTALIKTSQFKYIDVWPVNLFTPDDNDAFDVSSLFMMQLACIINMVPGWKNLELRVFLLDSSSTVSRRPSSTNLAEMNQITIDNRRTSEIRMQQLLKQLRIKASIHQVDGWTDILQPLRDCGGTVLPSGVYQKPPHLESVVETYLKTVNEMLLHQTAQTALMFLYLPPPPSIAPGHSTTSTALYLSYLNILTKLTDRLPPTILVHGISTVTSTTL